MKKLLAAGCTILALQSFSQIAPLNEATDLQSGRKVLIKAIAVIVNSENYRKNPPKRVAIPHLESPRI
ncbi:MAG: hypothetical protein EOO46_19340 [Flavobacterium sp.]|nr:MAG: hypothetical protein EOO46_19340 [Flavobacterium sp.]